MDISKCNKCKKEFCESDNIVYCPTCGAYYHIECWEENGGCNNPECADCVSNQQYDWLQLGNDINQEDIYAESQESPDNSLTKEKDKKRTIKKLINLIVLSSLFILGAILIPASILVEKLFSAYVLCAILLIPGALCTFAFIIYGTFLICKALLLATKENRKVALQNVKNQQNGEALIQPSKSTKRVNKVMTIIFGFVGLVVVTFICLNIFTCIFGNHNYKLKEQNDELCYDLYECKKCDKEHRQASEERKNNYPINHSFLDGNKCHYCGVNAKDYLATVIITKGDYNSEGLYEISNTRTYQGKTYFMTILYSPSTEKFAIQIQSLYESATIIFSKHSTKYDYTVKMTEDNLSITTVKGSIYGLDDELTYTLFIGSEVENTKYGQISSPDIFYGTAIGEAADRISTLVDVVDSYLDPTYIRLSDLN